MSKGIIVVEKIPENCRNIRGDENGCLYGGMVCQITQSDVMQHVKDGTKPDWCPIKTAPEKKPKIKQTVSPMITEQYEIYDKGWNACIDEIFKEKCNGDNE